MRTHNLGYPRIGNQRELKNDQSFTLSGDKIFREIEEAQQSGVAAKPVLLGSISYLLLGKEKELGFSKIALLDKLFPTCKAILKKLQEMGIVYIQLDDPFLALDLSDKIESKFLWVYGQINQEFPKPEMQ